MAIEVEGLIRRYGPLTAVDGVSFRVGEGEIFGILGPNGAGKTTTLEMIEGLRTPHSGRITLLGRTWARDAARLRTEIGVQLQQTALWDDLTALETMRLFAGLYPQAQAPAAVLQQLGLADKARARVGTLSGGQRQRLALGLALVHDPALLFLDEPTTGLDPQNRHALWDVVKELRARGKTIVLTTHYMEEAQALCDRVAIMDHGRIIALDTPWNLVRALPFVARISLDLEPELVAVAAGLPGVAGSVSDGGRTVFQVTDQARAMTALVGLLTEQRGGEAPLELNVAPATLEDVFLSLTGRGLRA